MSEIINTIKDNKKHLLGITLMVATLLALGFNSVFSTEGPSQKALDKASIAIEKQELTEEIEATNVIINDLRAKLGDLEDCNLQREEEIAAETVAKFKGCVNRRAEVVSTSSGTTDTNTGVTLNPGTEATPTPAKEEKPQA